MMKIRMYKYKKPASGGGSIYINNIGVVVEDILELIAETDDFSVELTGVCTEDDWYNYLLGALIKLEKNLKPSPAFMNRIIMNGGLIKYLDTLEKRAGRGVNPTNS